MPPAPNPKPSLPPPPSSDTWCMILLVVMIMAIATLAYFLGYCQGFANGKNQIYEFYEVQPRVRPIVYGSDNPVNPK